MDLVLILLLYFLSVHSRYFSLPVFYFAVLLSYVLMCGIFYIRTGDNFFCKSCKMKALSLHHNNVSWVSSFQKSRFDMDQ